MLRSQDINYMINIKIYFINFQPDLPSASLSSDSDSSSSSSEEAGRREGDGAARRDWEGAPGATVGLEAERAGAASASAIYNNNNKKK